MPTFFEHLTVIAQLAFRESGVQIAILETGLGGRFDATTATNAEIIGLTPIGMDHVKTLGPTQEDIAREKAATIRSDTSVFVGPQKKIVDDVINSRCAELGVEPHRVKYELSDGFTIDGQTYTSELGLFGKHQFENASLAIAIVRELADRGFEIVQEHIDAGLRNARNSGRIEIDDEFIFDGAHNKDGALALQEFLRDFKPRPSVLIYGSVSGKGVADIAELLFGFAEHVIVTTLENPRTLTAPEVVNQLPDSIDRSKIETTDLPKDALRIARELAGESRILVTGSLYLIGEIKAVLLEREVERRKKKP